MGGLEVRKIGRGGEEPDGIYKRVFLYILCRTDDDDPEVVENFTECNP